MLLTKDGFGKLLVGGIAVEKLVNLSRDLVLGQIVLGQGRDSLGLGEGEAHQRLPGAGFRSKAVWTGVKPDRALEGLLEGNTPATTNGRYPDQGRGSESFTVEVIGAG